MPPNVPTDIADTLAAMDRRIRELEGRVNIRPAQSDVINGAVTVGSGGQFKVIGPDGSTIIFWVGGIGPAHPDGSPQRGTLMYREDGSQAFALATAGPEPQGITMRDRSGAVIYAEDVVSGTGLANPNFGSDAWYGFTEVPAWTTTSSSFVTCMSLRWKKNHPRVQGYYLAKCDPGVSGEIRLVDGASSVIGTVALGAGAYQIGSITGAITGAMNADQVLTWQARVTGGAGAIGVRGLSTYGVGS